MGYTAAAEMLAHTDVRTALSWHLTSNHYPPVPTTMIEPCLEAIVADDPEETIELPEGVLWKGGNVAPAWAIIEGHHLEAFVDDYRSHNDEDEGD